MVRLLQAHRCNASPLSILEKAKMHALFIRMGMSDELMTQTTTNTPLRSKLRAASSSLSRQIDKQNEQKCIFYKTQVGEYFVSAEQPYSLLKPTADSYKELFPGIYSPHSPLIPWICAALTCLIAVGALVTSMLGCALLASSLFTVAFITAAFLAIVVDVVEGEPGREKGVQEVYRESWNYVLDLWRAFEGKSLDEICADEDLLQLLCQASLLAFSLPTPLVFILFKREPKLFETLVECRRKQIYSEIKFFNSGPADSNRDSAEEVFKSWLKAIGKQFFGHFIAEESLDSSAPNFSKDHTLEAKANKIEEKIFSMLQHTTLPEAYKECIIYADREIMTGRPLSQNLPVSGSGLERVD